MCQFQSLLCFLDFLTAYFKAIILSSRGIKSKEDEMGGAGGALGGGEGCIQHFGWEA
jgi:hypothetical protein